MKKISLFFVLMSSVSLDAFAGAIVKLGGSLDNQYGAVKQGLDFRSKNGQFTKDRGLVNNGKIKMEIDYLAESDLKYGGAMEFNANTSQSKTGSTNILNKSMIYVQSGFGRIEAGTRDGAGGKFREDLFKPLDVAASGAWGGDSVFWIGDNSKTSSNKSSVYILSPDLVVAHDMSGSANKVSYYSPKYNGMQLGVTYVPDAAIKGTVTEAMKKPNNVFSGSASLDPDEKPGYKNVFDISLKYEMEIKDAKIGSFFTGELGESKKYSYNNTLRSRRPLKAWDTGAIFSYKGFSLAGSYGNWRHSGVDKAIDKNFKQHSSFYTLGGGYSCGDLATSVTYFESKSAAGIGGVIQQLGYDRAKLLSLGAEYKLMPGLKPYAEITSFNLAEHDQRANKGFVTLVGVKLSF